MLNLDTNQKLKRVSLPSNMPFFIMTPNYNREHKKRYVITSIDEKDEISLDNKLTISINRGGYTFVINPNSVEAYGEIDFRSSSPDMDIIADFRFFTILDSVGTWLPSRYDYEEHCAYSDLNIPRIYDTFKPEVIAQYGHGCIGKPKRCVIFKHEF